MPSSSLSRWSSLRCARRYNAPSTAPAVAGLSVLCNLPIRARCLAAHLADESHQTRRPHSCARRPHPHHLIHDGQGNSARRSFNTTRRQSSTRTPGIDDIANLRLDGPTTTIPITPKLPQISESERPERSLKPSRVSKSGRDFIFRPASIQKSQGDKRSNAELRSRKKNGSISQNSPEEVQKQAAQHRRPDESRTLREAAGKAQDEPAQSQDAMPDVAGPVVHQEERRWLRNNADRWKHVAYQNMDEHGWNRWSDRTASLDVLTSWRNEIQDLKTELAKYHRLTTLAGIDAKNSSADRPGSTQMPDKIEPSDTMLKLMDYTGLALPIRDVFGKQRVGRIAPWELSSRERSQMTALYQLDTELTRFIKFMALTRQETAIRTMLAARMTQRVQRAIDASGHQFATFVGGSTATQLATPFSDIDIVLLPDHHGGQAKTHLDKKCAEILDMVNESLEKSIKAHLGGLSDLNFIRGAIPVINVRHLPTHVDMQIVGNAPTAVQSKKTMEYLARHRHLKTVFTIVRMVLEARGLLDVWNGGLSSYCVLMMIVAALNHNDRTSKHLPTAAEQLLYVLDFYANFDTTKHGICTSTGHLYPKYPQLGNKEIQKMKDGAIKRRDVHAVNRISFSQRDVKWLLSLQCPARPWKDLGNVCYAIKHIQATFGYLHAKLTKGIEELDQWRVEGSKESAWDHGPLLEPLVGSVHQVIYKRREHLKPLYDKLLQDRESDQEEGVDECVALKVEPSSTDEAVVKDVELSKMDELDPEDVDPAKKDESITGDVEPSSKDGSATVNITQSQDERQT